MLGFRAVYSDVFQLTVGGLGRVSVSSPWCRQAHCSDQCLLHPLISSVSHFADQDLRKVEGKLQGLVCNNLTGPLILIPLLSPGGF